MKKSSISHSPDGRTLAITGTSLGVVVEVLERERHAGPARHRDEVDHGVGRAGDRDVHHERVLERAAVEDVGGFQVLPDHLDDAPPAGRGHARMRGVGGRDRGRARQREAQAPR